MKAILKSVAIWAAMIMCSGTSANAGLILGLDADHIAYANGYQNVGWVERLNSDGNFEFNASGVLVHPNFILMSAHQALAIDNDLSSLYGGFRAGFGQNYLTNPGASLTASEIFIHPSYSNLGSGRDLALLYFETPFTNIAPANIFGGAVTAGLDSDIVGYGRLQYVGDPNSSFTGDRRAGSNVLFDSIYGPDFIRTRLLSSSNPNYDPLGMGGRSGDSGGGLFIGGQLAGITSFGALSNTSGITDYSLLDIDWQNTIIESKTTAVPEPSSFFLLLVGSSALALLRRRKSVA